MKQVETETVRRVAPSPHVSHQALTTRWMMLDVLIALAPVVIAAVVIFRWYAVVQVGLCVLSCVAFEAAFAALRGRAMPLGDLSAVVTGVILGLSLPWNAPWYIAVIGSLVAIGIGKAAFGGLGFNLFNPAMVGRAFVLLSFAGKMGASAYRDAEASFAILTQATPLTVAKNYAASLVDGNGDAVESIDQITNVIPALLGNVNGSLGETSAIAVLLGGVYLCVRRSASWQIPAAVVASGFVCAGLLHLAGLTPMTAQHHVLSGALLFGAFFIATDPVSSPLTNRGKWFFGIGVGAITVLLRVLSGYPEGVMFAVLMMNAAVPLINRWTIPRPLGGPVPQPT